MMSRVVCHNCGKKGHYKRDCPNPPSQAKGSGKGASNYLVFDPFASHSMHIHSTEDSKDTFIGPVWPRGGALNLQKEQSNARASPSADKASSSQCCLETMYLHVVVFPDWFMGLIIRPTHAIVDTGAQSGVVGLYNWQRWMICLVYGYGLRPAFRPVPPNSSAHGVGGGSEVLILCDIPVGVAGCNGLQQWAVVRDPSPSNRVPPLLPIGTMKKIGSLHDAESRKLCAKALNKVIHLNELSNCAHQTMSLLQINEKGWSLPTSDFEHLCSIGC